MKKKAAEKTKLTALDKIVRFIAGMTPTSVPAEKGRKSQCCTEGAKRLPDLGEMYKQAVDAQAELNETAFLDPDFKKKYTEVCELYRKISSCAESALKTLTEELSEIVNLQDRFSAGDKNVLYEMGRRIIVTIDKRYKKGLCDDCGAVDLSFELFEKLLDAEKGGDRRARLALDELEKSWRGWGKAGKRLAMYTPLKKPKHLKKPKAKRFKATNTRSVGNKKCNR